MRRMLIALAALAMIVAGTTPAMADRADGAQDLEGELGGAAYEIRVPDDWNGTLVVYAHGFRDKADGPGEVDDTSASAFRNDTFEEVMLAAGYAIAGSAYRDNGWAVQEGIADTKRLVTHFKGEIGNPDTTILVGVSMGSVVTFESIERFPGIYDGAIPACAVGAGAPRAFDGALAVMNAYDAVYGWPESWGTTADVRDDLDFDTEVIPVLFGQLTAPDGPAKFEFIRLAAGVPQGPEWPFSPMYFATEGRAELERRAGGPVAQNLDHTYELSAGDRAYLAAIGIDGDTADAWLAAMDANRADAPNPSRHYLEKYAEYTGKIHRPVLTLHTAVDALVPPAHISAYAETVADAGRSEWLASAFTDGIGHCNFTPAQLLTAVDAMQDWIDTGVAPTAFPAGQGFIKLDPPPWPQP